MLQGLRHHLQRPAEAIFVILALALGIGSATAAIALFYLLLFQPLPFAESEQLVVLWERQLSGNADFRVVSLPNSKDWQERTEIFQSLACAFTWRPTLRLEQEQVRIDGSQVTPQFFDVLNMEPVYGRLLAADDYTPDAPKVAVASYRFWRQQLGADPTALDRTIELDGHATTIVGVLPATVELTTPMFRRTTDLIAPLNENQPWFSRGNRMFRAVGKLQKGLAPNQAQTLLRSLAASLAQAYPEANGGWTVDVVGLRELMSNDIRRSILLLLAAAVMVLLVAYINVANLFAVQLTRRNQELALRVTLGAGRHRLVLQLLQECLPLVTAGALGAFLLARWMLFTFGDLVPDSVGWLLESGTGSALFATTVMVSLLVVLAIQVLLGLKISATCPSALLSDGTAGTGRSRRHHDTQQAILAGELALALILLISALLLMRSFLRLENVELGFTPKNVAIAGLALQSSTYGNAEAAMPFFEETLSRLEKDSRVESAAVINHLPLQGGKHLVPVEIPGRLPIDWNLDLRGVSPGYFATMGIPLIQGRHFTSEDLRAESRAVLVNETAASRLWPNEDAVGQKVAIQWGNGGLREIIGVVGDIRHESLETPAVPEAYLPYSQLPFWSTHLVARTRAEPSNWLSDFRTHVRQVDPHVLMVLNTTMERLVIQELQRPRQYSILVSCFALIGVVLAILGVYGVTSVAVSSRIRELGLRSALGAPPGALLWMVMARSGRAVGLGVLLGLLGSWALSQWIESLLYGIEALDPFTFIVAPLLLSAIALIATFLPSRKALDIDPAHTLRRY